MYEIYTDGAVSGNGKAGAPGGWAFVILKNGEQVIADSGGEVGTTNQRMELIAAINACRALEKVDGFGLAAIYSDSAYLVNCVNQNWWRAWKRNNWLNSKKEPVANRELWEQLIPYFENSLKYKFIKVKGHNGVDTPESYWNDIVDKMAVNAKFAIMEVKK